MKTLTVRIVLALVMAFFIFSCKAYRNVENLQPSVSMEVQEGPFVKESLAKLKEGDKLKVHLVNGEKYFMNHKQVNNEDLIGTVWKLNQEKIEPIKLIEIPIDHIEKVYVYRLSAAATAPLVLISALGVILGIIAIGFASGFSW